MTRPWDHPGSALHDAVQLYSARFAEAPPLLRALPPECEHAMIAAMADAVRTGVRMTEGDVCRVMDCELPPGSDGEAFPVPLATRAF